MIQRSDEADWRRLWSGYLAFYDQRLSDEITDRTWARMLDPAGTIRGRLATLDGNAAGFIVYVLHEGTWHLEPVCYLEDFYVDAPLRGRGVGKALIDDLIALGGKSQFSSIYWHTRSDNAAARRLYDRYGRADDFVRYRLTPG